MDVLAKKLLVASSMVAASAAFVVAMIFLVVSQAGDQYQAIQSGNEIIVMKTMHGYLPGAIIGGFGVFLYSLSMFAFLYRESLYKKLLPYCAWTCLTGVVAIFLGGFGISYYWHSDARSSGYVKCGMLDSVSTAKLHTSYWAKRDEYCNDPQLAEILRYATEQRLRKANVYLRSR